MSEIGWKADRSAFGSGKPESRHCFQLTRERLLAPRLQTSRLALIIARMRAIIVIACVLFLPGCEGKTSQASVPEGCYRFDDGAPFFRIAGRTGSIIGNAGLKSFDIGPWKVDGRELEVTPAFVLHDGTASAPKGPARMAETVTTVASGVLGFRRANGQIVLSVPVEAYGWRDVQLGKPC